MKTKFSLLFYIRKPKNYKNGPMPIWVRITVNGKRAETPSGRGCEPEQWNGSAGRRKGTKEEVRSFNAYLDDLQAKVYEAHRQLTEADELITAETIRNKFMGKSEKPHLLLEIFADHNQKLAALVGKEYTKGTLCRYETSLKHTRNFLKWKYNLSDIDIKQVDHAFITEYEFYLRSVRQCANNSAVKYIKNFGKIIRICIANRWLVYNPFLNYKNKIKTVDRVYLTTEELQELADKDMATDRLTQVRDIFLFCCYTGLAYADVKKLRRWEIVIGVDGGKWLSINRLKTDVPSRIPLLPTALALIDCYADHPHCENSGRVLPVLSNQKMNSYLKEIADVCGITKPITFHIARHTFATTVTLLNGVPIESVSKMLGHTNIQTTQHYAKILDIKVGADMALLRQKYAAV
ncbi:site-specific integrase [Mucilaginibacter rubeus]|uniref:Site-specific integrase n=1 Tax=Mucilaginibacter rubeus TaxID=2027860 RepID=A0AAE6MH88_9SPHI|nr:MULTISPECIES: site-specific integrase [Mucilaginibacter]QEM02989.1 site-specific integrase [Mucilaginibacter rubeus]QEM15607.1 site-specific integrase [Mucilaginibacter gossypii]QTE41658.1 site-specific integrase [Mucilaginibacter rubeus]QTE48263.1 site-specific integrase [Mucilaginibacter rubeus]QTE59651.1 site-specific integrase [Mucilaginibacter rubeus]